MASSNEVFTNAASVIAGFSFTALSIEHSTAFEYQAAENYLSVNIFIACTALSLGTSLLVVVSQCWRERTSVLTRANSARPYAYVYACMCVCTFARLLSRGHVRVHLCIRDFVRACVRSPLQIMMSVRWCARRGRVLVRPQSCAQKCVISVLLPPPQPHPPTHPHHPPTHPPMPFEVSFCDSW